MTDLKRIVPHNDESERVILGSILSDYSSCIGQCVEKFGGQELVFYDLPNQIILRAMFQMCETGIPIEIISLQQRLIDSKKLEECGGPLYLANLIDMASTPPNLSYYLDIVYDKFLLRKMIQACTNAVASISSYEGEVDRILDSVENDIMKVRSLRYSARQRPISEAVDKAINTIEDYHERRGIVGLPSGFPDLDKLTGGFCPADVFVLAGRPSTGKTSLAMNIAEHVSVDQGLPVGVFSLEMTMDALVMRLLCSRARVNFRSVRDGFLAERDFPRLTGAAGKMRKAPIWIDDSSGLSILELRAKARRMVQQHGVKLFVIDYLQLLHSTSKRAETRQQEIADISNGIKSMAKELGVPVILLSQLNRELDREKNRRPRLSDLRESGSIEQDADLVGMLYLKPTPEDQQPDRSAVPTNLFIAKQRNGPSDEDVPLVFIKGLTRFESASRVDDTESDQPPLDCGHPHND